MYDCPENIATTGARSSKEVSSRSPRSGWRDPRLFLLLLFHVLGCRCGGIRDCPENSCGLWRQVDLQCGLQRLHRSSSFACANRLPYFHGLGWRKAPCMTALKISPPPELVLPKRCHPAARAAGGGIRGCSCCCFFMFSGAAAVALGTALKIHAVSGVRLTCSAGYKGSTDPRPSPAPIAYPIFMALAGAKRHV